MNLIVVNQSDFLQILPLQIFILINIENCGLVESAAKVSVEILYSANPVRNGSIRGVVVYEEGMLLSVTGAQENQIVEKG